MKLLRQSPHLSLVPFLAFGLWTILVYSHAGPVLPLPQRDVEVKGASELYEEWLPLSRAQREVRVLEELKKGNVPSLFRMFRPVVLTDPDDPATTRGTMYVTLDYFSVGGDDDFLRMPVSGPLAQLIADEVGCYLPTRHIVNLIDQQTAQRPAPRPFNPADYTITSLEVFRLSHEAIEEQLPPVKQRGLISGIKKDIVITNQLNNRPPPPRVAIYGWHWPDGSAIQPLSLVHGEMYMDYSHGLRLVWPVVTIDGEEIDYGEALVHPEYHRLVSDEGAVTVQRYPTGNWP
ncbi:MAG: hypothetical protein JJU11_10810 [Candidatus Sumerlaeia bacterium]|nr:hypothetical protein [Candidatus Sumerlaeia bacterium]